MMNLHSRAILLALSSATFGSALLAEPAFCPALAQTSTVSTDAPAPKNKPTPAKAQKPKALAAHPKKQDIFSESEKKPASTTIPMDFSSMKKPSDQETSSTKSDFDGPMKPDLGGSNGMSPGMKFSW